MMFLNVVISTFLILNVVAEDFITTSEEMDAVINMLMLNDVEDFKDSVDNVTDADSGEEPVFSEGVWKCGECDDIDESKLLYTESYDVENYYDDTDSEGYVHLQVGMAMNMRCVTVTTDDSAISEVKRVSGACAGESVTLQVAGASRYDVQVYGWD